MAKNIEDLELALQSQSRSTESLMARVFESLGKIADGVLAGDIEVSKARVAINARATQIRTIEAITAVGRLRVTLSKKRKQLEKK